MQKDFDCVEMKRRIQEELLKEWEGLSPEEIRRYEAEKIQANPLLAKFWTRPPYSKAS